MQKLVVAGCLSQRYAPDLAKEMPDVDHFIGTGNFDSLPILLGESKAVEPNATPAFFYQSSMICPVFEARMLLSPTVTPEIVDGKEIYIPDPDFTIRSDSPRVATQPRYASYLKISEGCSNTCSFCIIPKIERCPTISDN